ncbi:asparagine synthase-related protein [Streptomyces roseolus]|uniref:asparagine synthase-related protein n=1 Tax=Streptomyces roseolus TaxID=67358 RepID=UPI0037A77C9A
MKGLSMMQGSWFVVLPDHEAVREAAVRLRAWAEQEVRHPSGRPWLLGRWESSEVTTARVGDHGAAVLGRHVLTETELATRLGAVAAPGGAERFADGWAGSFHLVLSVHRQVRVRGTASATRRVFTACQNGVTVASDRADVLAALSGAAVNVRRVAMRLLSPQVAHPFGEHSLWAGIECVPADQELVVDPGGRSRRTRWWRPPEAVLPMAEGAERVRTALQASLHTCKGAADVLSCDLSGGMDSTSLCFLAAGQSSRLATVRREAADPGNDDVLWAQTATGYLTDAHHLTLGDGEVPGWYADLALPSDDWEEPYKDIRGRAYRRAMARRMAGLGARIHVCGVGGDELFGSSPAYLHDLLRLRPFLVLGRLTAHRATTRWPLAAALRALSHRGTFDDWVKGAADGLSTVPRRVHLDWMPRLRLPPWATPEAVELVRDVLQEAAQWSWEPLSPSRVQHQTAQHVRTAGMSVRQVDRLMRSTGAGMAAPFLDDQVITAAMSVRLEDRFSATAFKPLLTQAVRDHVPPPLLRRTTKGDFSFDLHQALYRRRAELLHLTDALRLSELGLVDAAALRHAVLAPHPRGMTLTPLEATFSCESWLRGLDGRNLRPIHAKGNP